MTNNVVNSVYTGSCEGTFRSSSQQPPMNFIQNSTVVRLYCCCLGGQKANNFVEISQNSLKGRAHCFSMQVVMKNKCFLLNP